VRPERSSKSKSLLNLISILSQLENLYSSLLVSISYTSRRGEIVLWKQISFRATYVVGLDLARRDRSIPIEAEVRASDYTYSLVSGSPR